MRGRGARERSGPSHEYRFLKPFYIGPRPMSREPCGLLIDLGRSDRGVEEVVNAGHASTSRATVAQEAHDFDYLAFLGKPHAGVLVEVVDRIRVLQGESHAVVAPRLGPPEIRGSGYVVETLEAALWAFDRSSSFEEGALLAVNLGNDADTTGAVFGQIAGAHYGESGIPRRWSERLAMRETIESFANRLFHASQPACATARPKDER